MFTLFTFKIMKF